MITRVDVAVTSHTSSFTLETGHHTKITDPRRLFGVYDTRKPKPLSKKPVNYEDINTEELKEILIHSQIPDPLAGIADEEEINSHVDSLSNWLYERTLICKRKTHLEGAKNEDRWNRLLKDNDPKTIWKAISCRGEIKCTADGGPSDLEFKEHYESLLRASVYKRVLFAVFLESNGNKGAWSEGRFVFL